MGLFGPFIYKTKTGKKFWLHIKEKGKSKLFYFSKDPAGALNGLPGGYEVVENPKTMMPFLKKKAGGGFFGGSGKQKSEVKEEKPKEETSQEAK